MGALPKSRAVPCLCQALPRRCSICPALAPWQGRGAALLFLLSTEPWAHWSVMAGWLGKGLQMCGSRERGRVWHPGVCATSERGCVGINPIAAARRPGRSPRPNDAWKVFCCLAMKRLRALRSWQPALWLYTSQRWMAEVKVWGLGSQAAGGLSLPSLLPSSRQSCSSLVLAAAGISEPGEKPLPPDPAEGKPGVSRAKPQTAVCSQRIKIADGSKSRDAKYLPSEHKAGVVLPAWQNVLRVSILIVTVPNRPYSLELLKGNY